MLFPLAAPSTDFAKSIDVMELEGGRKAPLLARAIGMFSAAGGAAATPLKGGVAIGGGL